MIESQPEIEEIKEEMFFFESESGIKLLGFLHHASGQIKKKLNFGLVYCHPFAEEKNQSHGVVVRSARRFAALGIPVLRFDFSGCGDSEEALENASVQTWISEIGTAIELFKNKTSLQQVGLWGLRSGANLAALAALNRSDIVLGVFWQPLPSLKVFIQQFLRQKLSTELVAGSGEGFSVKALVKQLEAGDTVEVMGYPISWELYRGFNLQSESFKSFQLSFPCLIATISEGENPPKAIRQMALEKIESDSRSVFKHFQASSFWDRYWRWDAPTLAPTCAEWLTSLT